VEDHSRDSPYEVPGYGLIVRDAGDGVVDRSFAGVSWCNGFALAEWDGRLPLPELNRLFGHRPCPGFDQFDPALAPEGFEEESRL
jgi:hypothetical protein